MKRAAYTAAQILSPKVQSYFAQRHAEAVSRGQKNLATVPDAETIEAIIEAAFWASLRREEGYVPRISLALVSPREAAYPLLFERPLALDPSALTRVAQAVERPGIHLGVWHDTDERERTELCVWGTTRTIPTLSFVLEVAAPGLLVIKHHSGDETGKYVNVAVLEGDQIKLVDNHASTRPDCPAVFSSLLGYESATSWADSVNVLVQLAVSMRAHGRGGLLLLVRARSESWRESIVSPMPYGVSPPFCELAQLIRETPDPARRPLWLEAMSRAVDAIAGLTAVDGAVVLTEQHELLGFGAKIARRKGGSQVEQVTLTEPIVGAKPTLVHPDQLGGTRHLAAAQFVQDQHDAVALVASQDGRFTIFEWSECETMVHAHRVDALLL